MAELLTKFGMRVLHRNGHLALFADGTHGTEYLDYNAFHRNFIFGVHQTLQAVIDQNGYECEWENPEILNLYPGNHFSQELDDRQLMVLWNEYCDHIKSSDHIYANDEDAFELFGFTIAQTMRATKQDRYDWDDDYIQMDGYGNPFSFNDLRDEIDMAELEEYLYENEKL
jgi:hypothetical protein|tara:strand:- start:379 stop:888 length:510 start_codon:yes stop_codon:yes gene_type:complete